MKRKAINRIFLTWEIKNKTWLEAIIKIFVKIYPIRYKIKMIKQRETSKKEYR